MSKIYKKPLYIPNNPLGGVIHYEEEFSYESDQPFLDYWLECAYCEMKDIEKLKVMCFISEMKRNRYLYAKPFTELYFENKNNKQITAQIKKAYGASEIIDYIEKNDINYEDIDDFYKFVSKVHRAK